MQQKTKPRPLSPSRAIRRFCLECQGGYPPSVLACADADCPLYLLRLGDHATATPAVDVPAASALPLDGITSGASVTANRTEGMPYSMSEVGAGACSDTQADATTQENACTTAAGDAEAGHKTFLVRQIRSFCMACAENRKDVRACDTKVCPLWSYRFGVLPATFKRVVARRRAQKETLLLPGLRASLH